MTFVFYSTVYVLNCFQEILRHICIFYDLSVWEGTSGRTFYFDRQWITARTWAMCWLLMFGDERSQGISSHVQDLFFFNITDLQHQNCWRSKRYAKWKASVQSYTVSDHLICFSDPCQSLRDWDSQCMALQPEKLTQYASITVTAWPCGTLHRWLSPNCLLCGVPSR